MSLRAFVAALSAGWILTISVTPVYAGYGAPGFAIISEAQSPLRDSEDSPALRYGRLDREQCLTELLRRGAPFVPLDETRGVEAPLRLTGPLRGVEFRSTVPARQRATTPWEIVDCRLALALDDFAAQLREHDVVEVVHYSIYRPPAARWPEGQAAAQHAGAMAIDAAIFRKSDGSTLDVERDFHGHIGARPCDPSVPPSPSTEQALELREILCDAASAKLFNVALSPDYNRAHYNHFHLEVAAGSKWVVLR